MLVSWKIVQFVKIGWSQQESYLVVIASIIFAQFNLFKMDARNALCVVKKSKFLHNQYNKLIDLKMLFKLIFFNLLSLNKLMRNQLSQPNQNS